MSALSVIPWPERFRAQLSVNVERRGDCLVWLAELTGGYPILQFATIRMWAHRYVCASRFGVRGLKTRDVHHLCGNKACVDAAHLVPLTPSQHKTTHALGLLPTFAPFSPLDPVSLDDVIDVCGINSRGRTALRAEATR